MNALNTSSTSPTPRQSGMTLIELMVALAIGAFLMIGAMTVFMQSRTTFRVTESISRLQETARFALDAVEPDIRMAQYWGLTTRGESIRGRALPTDPAGIGPGTCGQNWTINFLQAVQGSNGSAPWPWPGAGCAANGTAETNSDTLVVRHVSDDTIAANVAGQMAVATVRNAGQVYNTVAIPPGVPGGFPAPPDSEIHRLVVNGYYVRRATANTPAALRRKWLRADGTIQDDEVIAGVEDMQIQFGLDTDIPGDTTGRGSVDRFVNPNDALIFPYNPNSTVEILAVRIWFRIRAERTENGFTDTANYVYADQNVGPFNDSFRRVLVSKTIYLRNARPPQ